MNIGSVEPLKQLHRKWQDRIHIADVITRQGHPGPDNPGYQSWNEKLEDARAHQTEDDVPWPVLVDHLDGSVHRRYGMLADPTYLIDLDGRVSFYNIWTHVPSLDQALTELEARGGRGVVCGGISKTPRPGATLTDGWKGLRRGLPQSVTDLEAAAPGMGIGPWVGHQLRPLLAPVTLRAEPLPTAARYALAGGAAVLLAWMISRRGRRQVQYRTRNG